LGETFHQKGPYRKISSNTQERGKAAEVVEFFPLLIFAMVRIYPFKSLFPTNGSQHPDDINRFSVRFKKKKTKIEYLTTFYFFYPAKRI
jgi:hypothetical protein